MNIKRIGLLGGTNVGNSNGTGSSTTIVDNLESISKTTALSANMGRELNETKAPKVGYAPDLKVNLANALVGRGEATAEEIGNIRPTGIRSIGDGNATITKIKGKSVIWNQGVGSQDDASKYQVFNCSITKTENGFQVNVINSSNGYSVEALKLDATHISPTEGHKYLISCDIRTEEVNKKIVFGVSTMGSVARPDYAIAPVIQNTWRTYHVLTPSWVINNQFALVRIGGIDGENYATSFEFKNMFLIDLTLMFGAGNEPTTIDEFEVRKPLGVSNEYNEGTIVSFQGDDVKSVGFNAWDEYREIGDILSGNGKESADTTVWRSSFIKVIPNERYIVEADGYAYKGLRTRFYTPDKTYISQKDANGLSGVSGTIIVIPENAGYMRIAPLLTEIPYDTPICVHLVHSGYRNGDYEPYVKDVHPLPDIKSIKDSNGDVLFPYGLLSAGSVHDEIAATKAIKRIGVVDMGTLEWLDRDIATPDNTSSYKIMLASSQTNKIGQALKAVALNTKYIWLETKALNVRELPNKTYMFSNGGIYLRDNDYTINHDFKQAMQGVLLYYELAEPIEVDLPEPLNMTYEAWDFGTEELVVSESTTPLNADIIYQFNAVDRIRENSTHIKEITDKYPIDENIIIDPNNDTIAIGSVVIIKDNINLGTGINISADRGIQIGVRYEQSCITINSKDGIVVGNANIPMYGIKIKPGFDSDNISGEGMWTKDDTYGVHVKVDQGVNIRLGNQCVINSDMFVQSDMVNFPLIGKYGILLKGNNIIEENVTLRFECDAFIVENIAEKTRIRLPLETNMIYHCDNIEITNYQNCSSIYMPKVFKITCSDYGITLMNLNNSRSVTLKYD